MQLRKSASVFWLIATIGAILQNPYSRTRLPKPFFIYAEDDPDAVFLVDAALRKLNAEHEMVHCLDGEQLISCLTQHWQRGETPTFVLLDVRMPRVDGFEALRLIRGNALHDRLSVVMFTSSVLEADVERAASLGATDYVVKPVSFDELTQKLSELLWRFDAL